MAYALITALLWGIGQIFIKKGLVQVSPLANNIFATIIALLIWVPFSLFFGVSMDKLISIIPFLIVVALGYISYFYILPLGKLSVTGTVIAMYPLISIFLSHIFLKESVTGWQKLALLFIILGCVLITLPAKGITLGKKSSFWILLWPFLGALSIGIAEFSAKLAINVSDPYTYLFGLSFTFVPLVLTTALIDKKALLPSLSSPFKKIAPTILGICMFQVGFITLNLALSQGLVSLVTPVSASYTAVTAFLAITILREKTTSWQNIGILICSAGVILLSSIGN